MSLVPKKRKSSGSRRSRTTKTARVFGWGVVKGPRTMILAEYARKIADEKINPPVVVDPQALTQERGKTHGDWTKQSHLAQALKEIVRANWDRAMDASQREAIEMILVKISRISVGNPNEPDHWNDIMGYAKLGLSGHDS